MGYKVISFRSSSDEREFKEAMATTKEGMRMAKRGFEKICELSDDMAEKYGERMGYSDRYSDRGGYSDRGDYSPRDYSHRDWDDMEERRYRDSMERYR